MVLTLGMASLTLNLLVALFLVVCVVLILTVLIQRPQGGGLSGAFGAGGGGSGSGQTAFGARTGDALTMATIAMFIIYLGVAVALNFAVRPSDAPRGGPALIAPPGSVEVEGEGAPATENGAATESTGNDAETPADAPDASSETDPDGAP